MATVGEATIKLNFDGKSLEASAKEVAGKVIGAGLAAGYGIASIAVKKFGVESVKQYANYEQLAGGIEKLYGESADKMMAYASESYKNAQMSATEYMKTATSFSASLIQGLGGDTKKAADYANRAITSMSDNANTFGVDIERIQDAYRGFARGQFNMLDNLSLGYGGTRSEMQRLIKDASGMSKEMKELGVTVDASSMSFDNIVNAISVVQKHMEIAGTSLNEAKGTIAGSFNMMKASAADLITGLSNPNADLGKLIDNFIESFEAFADNAAPAFERAITGIAKVLPKLVEKIAKILPDMLKELLPSLIQATISLVVALTEALPQLIPIIVDGLVQLVVAIVPYLPTILGALFNGIISLVMQLLASLGGAIGSWISSVFQGIMQGLGDFADSAVKALTDFASNAGKFAQQAWEGITSVFSNVAQFFGSVFSKAWDAVKKVFSTGGKIFDGIKEGIVTAFKAVVNAIIRGINKVVSIPFNAINGVLNGIRNIDIFGAKPFEWIGQINVPQIPELARGGYANGRSLATIGEAGKEAVIPLERNTDNWAGPLASALAKQFRDEDISAGRDITVYMTNNINNNLDADEIGRRLMTSFRRAS